MNTKTNNRRGPRKSSSGRTHSPRKTSRRGNFSKSRNSGSRSHKSGRRGFKQTTFDPSQFINKNPIEIKQEVYIPKNTFDSFGINSSLVSTIKGLGIKTPTPIQDQIIPEILKGKDVIGLAETGTGKTAAFLIPMIEETLKNKEFQALILTPTRELAIQIQEELLKLTRNQKIFSTTCVGGMNIRPQIRNLKRKNQFIIGTPGRIMDLIERKVLAPTKITTVVLDEADRMLDMGFIHDMRKILSTTPKNRKTLFFSATMNKKTEELTSEFLISPVTVSVKKKDVTDNIEQDVVYFKHDEKFKKLLELLEKPEFKRVLIFGTMKHSVRELAQDLTSKGVRADSIHGNKNHTQRQHALNTFKNGRVRALVATDVAARGIHVDGVTHVINYDLPAIFEDYVHRIGRTGRGDQKGKALTFVPQR